MFALVPHHEVAPLGTLGPAVAHLRGVATVALATLTQHHHLVGIGGLDFAELLLILVSIVAVEVARHDVYILVARIPVSILIERLTIAIIVLRGPHPDEVLDALLLEVIEHGHPQFLIGVGTIIAPPEPSLTP